MDDLVLRAKTRTAFGSRASRRLRREGLLPINIYGHGGRNLSATLEESVFRRFFEAGHRLATIDIDGAEEHGILKEVQYDSLGSEIIHADFARYSKDEVLEVAVPLEVVGVPKGVTAGGVLTVHHHELQIRGTAQRLPESYRIVVEGLGLGDLVRVRDLAPPEGCTFGDDPEAVVVAVEETRESGPIAEGDGAPTEPEVIRRPSAQED